MDRYLPPGYRLKNPSCSGEYDIKELIGTGASCAVYYATFLNGNNHTEHLLKEYNPRRINLKRDETGSLQTCKDIDIDAFEEGLRRFQKGYEMQMNVRLRSELKNTTSNIQTVFDTNGTCYIDITVMEGKTYNNIKEASLYDLLRRLKAITEIVGNYHRNGLLHLDIKPENILTIPETVEMVQMFDFDSVTPKADVARSVFLSYTQSWAAQEQILPNRRNQICEATDLYAIGEMLFFKLTGRHSEAHERRSFSTYQFDYAKELLRGVNPRVFALLSDILRHTICNRCADRYQTATELLEKLTEVISLADPKKTFLQHHLPPKTAFFIGREAEMHEIDERLKQDDKLFISGMGGMGKSELAKQYAHAHKNDYDAVIFAVCDNDLESMILDDSALPIENLQHWPDEKPNEYYKKKWCELKSLCNQRVLIIVDNLNNMQDRALGELLSLNCKMLFTTRCDVTEYNHEQLMLGVLAEEHVWSIFRRWYKTQLSNDEIPFVQQIIDLYQGHTMAVELIAKQMKASHTTPAVILQKLRSNGFRNSGQERVIQAKDGMSAKTTMHAHIRRLFDASELRREQVYVLANLALIPSTGISEELFHDWCKLDRYDDINALKESGWLRFDANAAHISLHPIIADVVLDNMSAVVEHSKTLLSSFTRDMKEPSFSQVKSEHRYHLSTIAIHICRQVSRIGMTSKVYPDFLCACADTFRGYGYVTLYIELLEQALQMNQGSVQNNMTELANINFVQGQLFSDLSSHQAAKKKYMAALKMYLQLYGEENTKTANAYNCIGISSFDLMQFEDAEKYYSKALGIWQAVCGENSSDVADALNNLGLLYSKLGDWRKAEHYFLKAIKIKQALHGEIHIDICTTYNNLACLYHDQGLYEKAEEFHKRALNICIRNYGENHHDTATSMNNLGSLYSDMGLINDAEVCYLKALDIMRSIYGEKHSRVAASYCNLGLLYGDCGQFEKAQINIRKSLEIEIAICGKQSREVAGTYYNLGSMYFDQGDFKKAEKAYLSALDIQLEVLTEMHKDTAITHNNLGLLYKKQGYFVKAEKHYKRALEIKRSVCNEDDPSTAISYENLGTLYEHTARPKSALACYKRAMKTYMLAFGEKSHESACLYFDIGRLYRDLGNIKQARKNMLIALKQCTDLYGKEHEKTIRIRKEVLHLSSRSG